MNALKARAILASAYNVCGPRTGTAATPDNVAGFSAETLRRCAERYAAHVAKDRDALFTASDVRAAVEFAGLSP